MAVTSALVDGTPRVGSTGTTSTVTGVTFGAAAAGRVLVEFVTFANNQATGITIGGVTGVITQGQMASAVVPTGTSGSAVGTFPSSDTLESLGVVALSGASSATPFASTSGGFGSTLSINVPASGSVVIFAFATSTGTWTGATGLTTYNDPTTGLVVSIASFDNSGGALTGHAIQYTTAAASFAASFSAGGGGPTNYILTATQGSYTLNGKTVTFATTVDPTTPQTETTSGSYTFNHSGTLLLEAWGGGASAGRRVHGAGGGAYSRTTSVSVTSGQTLFWNVPAAPAGSTSTTGGTNPASDSWANVGTNSAPSSTSTGVLADSGVTGSASTNGTGGLTANCIGNSSFAGGAGSSTGSGTTLRGGGGGGAGSTGAGGNASGATAGSAGGTDGGAGGAGTTTNPGGAGTAPGGGGGSTDNASGTGGTGSRGQVRWTFTQGTPTVALTGMSLLMSSGHAGISGSASLSGMSTFMANAQGVISTFSPFISLFGSITSMVKGNGAQQNIGNLASKITLQTKGSASPNGSISLEGKTAAQAKAQVSSSALTFLAGLTSLQVKLAGNPNMPTITQLFGYCVAQVKAFSGMSRGQGLTGKLTLQAKGETTLKSAASLQGKATSQVKGNVGAMIGTTKLSGRATAQAKASGTVSGKVPLSGTIKMSIKGAAHISGTAFLNAKTALQVKASGAVTRAVLLTGKVTAQVKGASSTAFTSALSGTIKMMSTGKLVNIVQPITVASERIVKFIANIGNLLNR